jgi:hypothetical protein
MITLNTLKQIFSLILTAGIVGCLGPLPPTTVKSTFNEREVSEQLKIGNNSIIGQAFIQNNNGEVITCSGNDVFAFPDSGYAREIFQKIIMKNGFFRSTAKIGLNWFDARVDKEKFLNATHKTQCDTQGNFRLDRLANGKWFVVTSVLWHPNKALTFGGDFVNNISVYNGQELEIVMTCTFQKTCW